MLKFVLHLVGPKDESYGAKNNEYEPLRKVHWLETAVLESHREVDDSNDGEDSIWGKLILDDAPLLFNPVLFEEALNELGGVDLTR